MSGRIVERTFHNQTYYYYKRSLRVKLDPQRSGKHPGSGKSQVKTENIYLGKAEDILHRFRENKQQPTALHVREFGLPCVLLKIAHEIRLLEIINQTLPYKVQGISAGEFILISAINKVAQSVSKDKTGDWFSRTVLPDFLQIQGPALNSKSYWSMFERIISEKELKQQKKQKGKEAHSKLTIEELEELIQDQCLEKIEEALYKELVKKYDIALSDVLYDTTNFYTYYNETTPTSLAQKGKNKAGKSGKRQIGLTMALARGVELPVLHQLYCGQINDSKVFPHAIKNLVHRYVQLHQQAKELTLIFDKGNNSQANFKTLEAIKEEEKIQLHFVGSLVPSQHKDLMEIPLEQYRGQYQSFSFYETEKEVFGQKRKVVVTFNPKLKARQEINFQKRLAKIKQALVDLYQTHKKDSKRALAQKLGQKLSEEYIGSSKAKRYLELRWQKGKKLEIAEKEAEVAWRKKLWGKHVLFTDMGNRLAGEIIALYKSKKTLEDSFSTIKDHRLIGFHPIYHWTDTKIRIDGFVSILGFLLIKLAQYIARKNGLSMSVKVLVYELKGIQEAVVMYSEQEAEKKMCQMSTVQKMLFDRFELDKMVAPYTTQF